MEQWSLFRLSEHLERLSKTGDPLEALEATVDFEHFRGWLVEGLGLRRRSQGWPSALRSGVDVQKALILQAQHDLRDARMEFMIRDWLSWMRFLRFDLGGQTDAAEYRARQCREIVDPWPCRTRLRPPEEQVRPVHPHHRHRTGRGEAHPRQYRLQLRSACLP